MSGLSRGYDTVSESSLSMALVPLLSREEVLESDSTLQGLVDVLSSYEKECERHKKKLIDHLFLKVATLSA